MKIEQAINFATERSAIIRANRVQSSNKGVVVISIAKTVFKRKLKLPRQKNFDVIRIQKKRIRAHFLLKFVKQ